MGKNVAIGILVVLVLALGGYTVYDNFIKKDKEDVVSNPEDDFQEDTDVISIDSDTLGKYLYENAVLIKGDNNNYIFIPDGNSLSYETMDGYSIGSALMNKIGINEMNYNSMFNSETCVGNYDSSDCFFCF